MRFRPVPPPIATRCGNFCPILLYIVSELDGSRERPKPALEPEPRLVLAGSVLGLYRTVPLTGRVPL